MAATLAEVLGDDEDGLVSELNDLEEFMDFWVSELTLVYIGGTKALEP